MKLILLGAPGAGKGTQAENISGRYEIPTISTGNMIRAAIHNGTELGKQAESLINAGKLVPDEVVIGMIRERLAEEDCKNGFILDGFPRTIPQAEALKKMLADRGHEMGMMIELVVEEDVLMARLLNRAIEQGRADDNEETIKKRFAVYHSQTAPLSEWFAQEGIRNTFAWSELGTKEGMLEAIFKTIDEQA